MNKTEKLMIETLESMKTPCGLPLAPGVQHHGGETHHSAEEESNYNAYMAKSDLFNIAENATMLHELLSDDYPLEDWVEAKITKAADYIRSVFQYLKYEMERNNGQVGVPQDDMTPQTVYISTNTPLKGLQQEKKLCKRGKSAAKAKFDVYPSAYANAYASKVCAGKVKDNKGKKRKDW